jgi:hypothetical protein
LKDLITSAEGTARLRSEQVFVDVAEFRGQLKTPASSRLSQHLGLTAAFLVMSGHQIHTTYRQSVQSKFSALHAVDRLEEVATCFIWVDTTRCGADHTISRLEQEGLDPQVKPVEPDYLPLHVACARDYRRLKLRRQTRGKDHFAVAGCTCGEAYSFYLGRSSLCIATLVETNQWSPDVSLPSFLNQLVSGHVAGKSSALYGLVLNAVMRDGLGIEPVPVLVPEQLGDESPPSPFIDCLLHRYFFGLPQQERAGLSR